MLHDPETLPLKGFPNVLRKESSVRPTSATFIPTCGQEPTLREILVALSFALDLTEGAVPGHSIRSCLLGMRIALAAGLDGAQLTNLYYASLLKDVGCSSNSARMCQIVGGDDRAVKAGAKLADWTRPLRPRVATLKMLWQEVLPEASILERGARIVKLAVTQHYNNKELIEIRCDRGAQIVRKLGLNDHVAIAVRHLDEHWNGGGYPSGWKGKSIPLLSRIMGIAQHLDAFCMDQGPAIAIDTLVERSGRWFDPQLVKATVALHRSRTLWEDCLPGDSSEQSRAAILRHYHDDETQLSALDIDAICEAFADVVDAKSPFTYRHSVGVRDAAVAIGQVLGLRSDRMQLLSRAAFLHDLGKLSISNTILDKPGKLTGEEFLLIQGHPLQSAAILNRVAAFREMAILAGEHHEKLDGTGYPYGLRAPEISLESRILAVADLFGALSEDRPYRKALDPATIRSIMERDVPKKLDPVCYEAICQIMDDANSFARLTHRPPAETCMVPIAHPEAALPAAV
jgi:HD-GYP domain-containing protein (c-di-GMP phosphodiesterase class II)